MLACPCAFPRASCESCDPIANEQQCKVALLRCGGEDETRAGSSLVGAGSRSRSRAILTAPAAVPLVLDTAAQPLANTRRSSRASVAAGARGSCVCPLSLPRSAPLVRRVVAGVGGKGEGKGPESSSRRLARSPLGVAHHGRARARAESDHSGDARTRQRAESDHSGQRRWRTARVGRTGLESALSIG